MRQCLSCSVKSLKAGEIDPTLSPQKVSPIPCCSTPAACYSALPCGGPQPRSLDRPAMDGVRVVGERWQPCVGGHLHGEGPTRALVECRSGGSTSRAGCGGPGEDPHTSDCSPAWGFGCFKEGRRLLRLLFPADLRCYEWHRPETRRPGQERLGRDLGTHSTGAASCLKICCLHDRLNVPVAPAFK